MTIVVTGGGSGGHITPLLAVAEEIKKLQPEAKVIYIGQSGDKLFDVAQNSPHVDESYKIYAGKFRRYHEEGPIQLLYLRTQALNVRDLARNVIGLWQSWRLLGKLRPEVVFTRGGFVSVPVALAAALRRIPYVTHDSDNTPSLANRLIAPWATLHAVALDPKLYTYPIAKTVRVGVPISREYQPVDSKAMLKYRKDLGLEKYEQIICVTGGGNGAKELNKFVLDNSKYLLGVFPKLVILHIAGRMLAEDLTSAYKKLLSPQDQKRVIVKDFVNDLYRYSGAADLIVARSGATNLAEFATQAKACIIIPAKQLVWQVKYSEALAKDQAIVELTEDQADQERRLATVISDLLNNPDKRAKLATKFTQYAYPNAARSIAELIVDIGTKGRGK